MHCKINCTVVEWKSVKVNESKDRERGRMKEKVPYIPVQDYVVNEKENEKLVQSAKQKKEEV